jgi:hypothetical protein
MEMVPVARKYSFPSANSNMPGTLSSGKPLFANLKERVHLKLMKTNTFKSGVVQLIYEAKR